jgi:EF hand
MKKALLAATAMSLGLMAATVSLPARADAGDITFNAIFAMADKNKDSMITKQEFLDAMGKAYDMKVAKMKAAKDADKMMKGNAMTMDGFKSLINDVHSGA